MIAVVKFLLTLLYLTHLLVLGQRYELSVEAIERLSVVTLQCRDTSINDFVDVNTVTFWLNRTTPDDPDVRDRSDVEANPGQSGTSIIIIMSRSVEGGYTCGQRRDSSNVEESSPAFIVSLLPFNIVVDQHVQTFFATSGSEAVLRCPIQPGALTDNYFGTWTRNGERLVEIPMPINGNSQDITQFDAQYDLDRATFSLKINSVNADNAGGGYRCDLSVLNPQSQPNPFFDLQTSFLNLSLMVNEDPVILEGPRDLIMALNDDDHNDDDDDEARPSFTCVAAGLPAPNIIWTYLPNLDGNSDEISLTNGRSYRVVSNSSSNARDDGRCITTSTVTFLEVEATDGGLIRCRTGSPNPVASADALFTVIGPPDEIDVIVSTRNEFIYDVVLPVLLQRPVKLRISYVDASRQDTSDGILTTTEYNDTRSIIYREVDTGQLPFERYFVRISIVAEFGNRRVEGPALTSSELVDTTMPSAQVVIFGLSGGVATALLILLIILPCVTAIGCCVCNRNKGCCTGSCCSESSNNIV